MELVLNFNHGEVAVIEEKEETIWLSFSHGSELSYPMTKEEASLLAAGLRHVLGEEKPLTPIEKVTLE